MVNIRVWERLRAGGKGVILPLRLPPNFFLKAGHLSRTIETYKLLLSPEMDPLFLMQALSVGVG